MSMTEPSSGSGGLAPDEARPGSLGAAHLLHDLKNMLNVMAGCLSGLRLRLPDPASDPDLAELSAALSSAVKITGELLSETRAQAPERHAVDVSHQIAKTQGALGRLIGPGVTLTFRATTGAAYVMARPAEIERIVTNLAMNARDSMRQGGELTIEVGLIHAVDGRSDELDTKPKTHVRITIADTGDGIDPELLPRIFQPYFSTKDDRSGIGLVSVSSIVRSLDGWLLVESEPGNGTRIHVCLPAL
jgi:signal transduction histidine kinase